MINIIGNNIIDYSWNNRSIYWKFHKNIESYKKRKYLILIILFCIWTILGISFSIFDYFRIQRVIESQGGSNFGGGLGNTLIFIWYAWAGGYFVIFLIFIYVNEQIKKYEKYPYLFYWRKYYYY